MVIFHIQKKFIYPQMKGKRTVVKKGMDRIALVVAIIAIPLGFGQGIDTAYKNFERDIIQIIISRLIYIFRLIVLKSNICF